MLEKSSPFLNGSPLGSLGLYSKLYPQFNHLVSSILKSLKLLLNTKQIKGISGEH